MIPSAAVRFDSVDKRFGQFPALQSIKLSLPSGEVSAIVGESGSGKSTLLQLINAVHRPDAGRVEVLGEPVPERGLPAFRRRIGYAVQGAGLFPHLSARDNVLLPARLAAWDLPRSRARYRTLLAMMGLDEDLLLRYPHQLSGGQQQRVGLCRALMLGPQLLLLDEPFSALDPVTRLDIQQAFEDLQQRQPVSSVLVTHDMDEALRLADYLVILRRGRVIQAGTRLQVLEAPAEAYVARLLRERGP